MTYGLERGRMKRTAYLLAVMGALAALACACGNGAGAPAAEEKGSAESAEEKENGENRQRETDMAGNTSEDSYENAEYWQDEGYDEEYWFGDDWYEEGYEEDYPYDEDSLPTDPKAYAMTEAPDEEGEYLILKEGEKDWYLRIPANRTETSYLESQGAFRFEIPHDWIWGSCDLDERLDSFWEYADVPCLIWAIDDNDMGVNAFSEDWEGVCASVESTAQKVFGDRMEVFRKGRYTLEDGQETYAFWCKFRREDGQSWTVSAAYRFGEKNMLEFISINPVGENANIENLALYTASTYEEYEGERYREYEGEGHYKGMDIWDYKKFHNPFVLAYEQANGQAWHMAGEIPPEEDVAVEWKEDNLPAAIREALGIDDRELLVSDLMGIEYLEAAEVAMEDYFIINEQRVSTDWALLENGDALVEDIANLRNLSALSLQIGNISDFSPLGELKLLAVLNIEAGRTVKDIGFLRKLENLRQVNLEKAAQQIHIDSMDENLWERTCKELEYATFSREYEGESGNAFDGLDFSGFMEYME